MVFGLMDSSTAREQDALEDQRPEPSGDLFVERQLALVINRDHNLPFRESLVLKCTISISTLSIALHEGEVNRK